MSHAAERWVERRLRLRLRLVTSQGGFLVCYMPLARVVLPLLRSYGRGIFKREGALEAAPRSLLSAALHANFEHCC